MLRQASTAASSRKNDSDSSFPLLVRLSNRSTEIKPSMVSSTGRSSAARSKYSCLCSGFGQTSKITAIMSISSLSIRLRRHLSQKRPLLDKDEFVLLGEIEIGHALFVGAKPRPVAFIGREILEGNQR